MSGNVSMNGGHAGPSRPPPLAPRPLAASASPAQVESPPVNGKRKPPGKSGFSKGKKKEEQSGSDSDELGEDGHPRKRARNRMALSCKECKRRKIKCDRAIPFCGQCEKRGRPAAECTWDLLSNEAALPTTIARTSDLERVIARLAHVEAYLKTLPPNLASFAPLTDPRTSSSTQHQYPQHQKSIFGHHVSKPDVEDTFSETEDAAVVLENGVFRSAPFTNDQNGQTELSRTAKLGMGESLGHVEDGRQRNQDSLRDTRFGYRSELTKALTSIISPHRGSLAYSSRAGLNIEFDASPAEVERARVEAVIRIYRAIPGRDVVGHLVHLYFTRVSWLFHHLHSPSFLAELDAFNDVVDNGRVHEVDILWISLLLMVLCVALDSTHTSRSPLSLDPGQTSLSSSPLSTFTEEQLRALPETWFHAAQAALALAEWETIPRVRSIQTIILFTQYLQLCSPNRGQPSQLVTWLAGATRVATVLGLHLLGSNPEIMPAFDDPAFPPGKNSVKREQAKRLWAVLVYQDWIGASEKNRVYLISPLQFDTDDPFNLNDGALSPIDWKVDPLPPNVLTDATSDRIRVAMARQVRKVFDAMVLRKDWSYETVLELDSGYHDILESLPDQWTLEVSAAETEQPMLRYQRHFALEGLHNRIFRLHRPFSTRGYYQPKYRFSTDACLKSARVVIVSTHNISDACKDIWYTYSHVLSAALILFNDLFHAIDHDFPAAEIDSKKQTLLLAAQIFDPNPGLTSPPLQRVVEQGSKILTGLFKAEESRRVEKGARALMSASAASGFPGSDEAEMETFAEVLQRISRSLNNRAAPHTGTPPDRRNLPLPPTLRPQPTLSSSYLDYHPSDMSGVAMPLPLGLEGVAPLPWIQSPPIPVGVDDLSTQMFQDWGMLATGSTTDFWAPSALVWEPGQGGGIEDGNFYGGDGNVVAPFWTF